MSIAMHVLETAAVARIQDLGLAERRSVSDLFVLVALHQILVQHQQQQHVEERRLAEFLSTNEHYNVPAAIFELVNCGRLRLAFTAVHARDPSLFESVLNVLMNRSLHEQSSCLQEVAPFLLAHASAYVGRLAAFQSGIFLSNVTAEMRARLVVSHPAALKMFAPVLVADCSVLDVSVLSHIASTVSMGMHSTVRLVAILWAIAQCRGRSLPSLSQAEADLNALWEDSLQSQAVLVDQVDQVLSHALHLGLYRHASALLWYCGRIRESVSLDLLVMFRRLSPVDGGAIRHWKELADKLHRCCAAAKLADLSSGAEGVRSGGGCMPGLLPLSPEVGQVCWLLSRTIFLFERLSGEAAAADAASNPMEEFVSLFKSRMDTFAPFVLLLLQLQAASIEAALPLPASESGHLLEDSAVFCALAVLALIEYQQTVVQVRCAEDAQASENLLRQIEENVRKHVRRQELVRMPVAELRRLSMDAARHRSSLSSSGGPSSGPDFFVAGAAGAVVGLQDQFVVFTCGHYFHELEFRRRNGGVLAVFEQKCADAGLTDRYCGGAVQSLVRGYASLFQQPTGSGGRGNRCLSGCPPCAFNALCRMVANRVGGFKEDKWVP